MEGERKDEEAGNTDCAIYGSGHGKNVGVGVEQYSCLLSTD